MKRFSMFSRLLTVFLAVILLCTAGLSAFSILSTRSSAIETRTKELKEQAYDLAYLASQMETERGTLSTRNSTASKYLRYKAQSIYERFSAYCIVIDRTGAGRAYINEELLEDEQVVRVLNQSDFASIRRSVMAGEEVVSQTSTENGLMFSVAVPWMHDGSVNGGIIVQTAAQTIRATYLPLILPYIIATAAAIVLAGLLIFLLTRQVTRPLRQMEDAARRLAQGDFTVRAIEEGGRETESLARSFNHMARQLGELETSRREFLANVSHELRSPITSIQGYLSSIQEGVIPRDEQGQYIDVVLTETRRLSKLVNGLLNLSRMEREDVHLSYSDFDLNEMTRRVLITKMTQLEEKSFEISADFFEDPCYAHADADKIEQVLVNLIDNALKYSPENSTLTLSTRPAEDKIILSVSDNGPGVSKEDAPHIFDRFYMADKAHTSGKGTGLGLAICKSIMEKHGEQIYLKDTAVGATFEFTLKRGTAPLLGEGNEDFSQREAEPDP